MRTTRYVEEKAKVFMPQEQLERALEAYHKILEEQKEYNLLNRYQYKPFSWDTRV